MHKSLTNSRENNANRLYARYNSLEANPKYLWYPHQARSWLIVSRPILRRTLIYPALVAGYNVVKGFLNLSLDRGVYVDQFKTFASSFSNLLIPHLGIFQSFLADCE